MDDGLVRDLVAAARKRWVILLAGYALLALLFVFAGMIRTPGARKNPYTVIASRALAVAGALLLTRIVLLTHEDGTPVFLIDVSGLSGETLEEEIGFVDERFDVVPMSDIIAFIRDQRYIPKKGAGLVLRVGGPGELDTALRALNRRSGPAVTLLLGESLAGSMAAGALPEDLPGNVGVAVEAGPEPGGTLTDEAAAEKLGALSEKVRAATGRTAGYARLAGDEGLVLGRIGKAAAIEAFFGGNGLNRYGDRGNRVRLADITAMLASGGTRKARIRSFVTMYRGNYLTYPTWAWLEMTAPLKPENDT
jgi:hypothetical protein